MITQSYTLTDTQRQLLTDAAQRPDSAITSPERRGRAVANAAQALLAAALVREIRAKVDLPVWRQVDETGRRFSLVLTRAGRAIVGEITVQADQQPAWSAEAPDQGR